jgi:G3E family GTPase
MRATIVYGFLGAGKTTLLRSLVPQLAALESTALLVNEFGVEGVDQVVLASDDLTVRQLVGGCVCCEVRGDLMVALDEIHRSVRPERLVIEPTGLASPDTLAHVFASPSVRSIVDVDSVITVLDATRYALVRDYLGEFFPNQVRHADLVVVNKTDAASDEQRLDARAWARALNAEAAIVESVYCDVDSDLLLATVRQGGVRMGPGLVARKTPHPNPLPQEREEERMDSRFRENGGWRCGR